MAQLPLTNVNAGVLPYACVDGNARYLLAFDPNPDRLGWANFGGGPAEGELAKETALREFNEETNCVFDINDIDLDSLSGPSGFFGYYTYLAEVPYTDPKTISAPRTCAHVERTDWVWVNHDDLIAALTGFDPVARMDSIEPARSIHLWDGSAGSLRKALGDDVISKADPCVNQSSQ